MMKKLMMILIMLTLSFAAMATEEKPVEQKKRLWKDEDYAGRYYATQRKKLDEDGEMPDLVITHIPDGLKITVLDSFYYLCKIDEVIVEYFENSPSEKLILKCGIFVWDGVLDGNTYIRLSMGYFGAGGYLILAFSQNEDKNCLIAPGCTVPTYAYVDLTR